MKFVFFGSPQFANIILERLTEEGFSPRAAICSPDRPVGRKKILTPPPVKSWIIDHETWNIGERPKILQPEVLDSSFRLQVSSFKPDFAIVAAYPKIIPKEILEMFPKGVIGVHPSLLPKYRGASPIQSAILNGEQESGTTLYLMDEKMDNGPILGQSEIKIEDSDNYKTLHDKLASISGNLLIKTLPPFMNGEIEPQEQDYSQATFTKKIKTEDGFIEFEDMEKALGGDRELAVQINNKIRALCEEPGAWTTINGKRVKLLESKKEDDKLTLLAVHPEGRKPMSWREFEKFYEIR